ncbi:MAG TPA: membrane protein insertase YidC [Gammaproteobacteria bacterium]|nr:membrane protein insertase YidC [Gammaproteobacteria bacterium]
MQLWTTWLETLRAVLALLSSDLGLGLGLAIVVLTLCLRAVLLPVSWSCAYRACLHQKRVGWLQPEIRRLRERYANQPQALTEETMKLYRRRGLRLVETWPILGAFAQMPVFLGMFSVLRQGFEGARFLWVASLSRSDFWLALIAGATTVLMMLANPDLPEQTRMALILIPSVIAFVFALKFASALAIYWVTSNCFTAAQTFAVHGLVERRIRAGDIEV